MLLEPTPEVLKLLRYLRSLSLDLVGLLALPSGEVGDLPAGRRKMITLTRAVIPLSLKLEVLFRRLDQIFDEAVDKFPRSDALSSSCSRMYAVAGLA